PPFHPTRMRPATNGRPCLSFFCWCCGPPCTACDTFPIVDDDSHSPPHPEPVTHTAIRRRTATRRVIFFLPEGRAHRCAQRPSGIAAVVPPPQSRDWIGLDRLGGVWTPTPTRKISQGW